MNQKFGEYAQSTAFVMTLSKGMISALQYVRDMPTNDVVLNRIDGNRKTFLLSSHFVPTIKSVERRGLVNWHPYEKHPEYDRTNPWKTLRNHRSWTLTRAGELMCELLVEAGLMAEKQRKKRSAA